MPSYFGNIHIQPNTFFAEYLNEGKNARIEFSHFFKGINGYTHNQLEVINMTQFKSYANAWVLFIKKEIETLVYHTNHGS